jgi:hypothetical protein
MKDENLCIPELKKSFYGRKFMWKEDLREFYRAKSTGFDEKSFRRILYALEMRELIVRIDSGVYTFANGQAGLQSLEKFVSSFSPELRELNNIIRIAFPYAEYLLWETRVLHEFMLHLPGQSQILLEPEKEAAESVFNFLNTTYAGKVFLKPDRVTFERYILPRSESIIVMPLLTQSPYQREEGIPTPKLEKILVDIFADEEIFYVLHGNELANIYETAFQRYRLSQKTIFRYARRRNVDQKIRAFVNQKTTIQLVQPVEKDSDLRSISHKRLI